MKVECKACFGIGVFDEDWGDDPCEVCAGEGFVEEDEDGSE
jgi:DnaJ-class molecular chaperone